VKVTWLLECDVFSEDLAPLKNEVIRQGHEVRDTSYVPFITGDEHSELYEDDEDRCVVFYGSLNLAKHLMRCGRISRRPIVYCTLPNYDCRRYYAHLGKFLLNGRYIMLPYAEMSRNKDLLFESLGQDGTVFVRPDSGDKTFTGQLVYNDSFDKDYERLGLYDVKPDTLVVVSEPRNLIGEWRFVVVEKKIVAGSPYKDSRPVPTEAYELAERVAMDGYEPDTCWVLDICQTQSGGFYLLEIGSFSCAGLYKCDMEPIVREVSQVSLRQHEDNR
jgi:hypothetical protein